ncbi:hypothetical protein [Nitrosomonas sp. Nm166]|uniref:hypothetical protein n=1 Tax=Nitrosomonas sp. Nm166 TaxID=1881054 RepID=UPI00116096CD|nr:hypothetical protein [Nitrosomonas sp. Nm166]
MVTIATCGEFGDGYGRGIHTAPASESEITHFEAIDKGLGSQRQLAVSKTTQNQERDYAPGTQKQTALSTTKVGK